MNSGLPLVLDADALVLLAQRGMERLKTLPHRPILTPHAGDFTRLFGSLDGSKPERVRQAAAASNSIAEYKGADKAVASRVDATWIAPPASAWLATDGPGDSPAGQCADQFAACGRHRQ